MLFGVVRKANLLMARSVLFAKLNFAMHCESGIYAVPLNTRIFASDFRFGEFHAILRGVFVKKIHIFFKDRNYRNLRNFFDLRLKIFREKNFVGKKLLQIRRNYFQKNSACGWD